MNKKAMQKKLRTVHQKQLPSAPSMPQRLQATFSKKMLQLHNGSEPIASNVLSILDKGSLSNVETYCLKSSQNTYHIQTFQNQEDYQRQKLLIQTLNMMGKCVQNSQGISGNLKPETNYEWNYQNPRYPYIKSYSDQDLLLEIEVGKVPLQEFQKFRVKKSDIWLDREIQFLMKSLCKSVLELYNCGVFHGNISPEKIFLRQNMIGCYEPVLTNFNDATNDYKIINSFDPKYWNFHNKEVKEFSSKEDRLSHELYQIGRVVQRCMLDQNTKHEENLFKNQTNQGIERCIKYFRSEKSSQFSQKTVECLTILLSKGDLGFLIKRFKKFNKDQMIADDNMKVIDEIFSAMCIQHPQIEIKRSIQQQQSQLKSQQQQQLIQQQSPTNNNNCPQHKKSSDSTATCDTEDGIEEKTLKEVKENQQNEAKLQVTLQEMKKSQVRKQIGDEKLLKKCDKKKLRRQKKQLVDSQIKEYEFQKQNEQFNTSQESEESTDKNQQDQEINVKFPENMNLTQRQQQNLIGENNDDCDSVLDEIEILDRKGQQYSDVGEAQSDWDVLSQCSRLSCFEEV